MAKKPSKIGLKLKKQLIEATSQQEVALIQSKLNVLKSGK